MAFHVVLCPHCRQVLYAGHAPNAYYFGPETDNCPACHKTYRTQKREWEQRTDNQKRLFIAGFIIRTTLATLLVSAVIGFVLSGIIDYFIVGSNNINLGIEFICIAVIAFILAWIRAIRVLQKQIAESKIRYRKPLPV